MNNLAVVRSMSTREADHNRGRYYMHTGYVPNPTIEHPSYGAVVAHELADKMPQSRNSAVRFRRRRQRWPGLFGNDVGPVRRQQQRRSARPESPAADPRNMQRLSERLTVLDVMEARFHQRESRRGGPTIISEVLKKTVSLMTSKQMDAFKVNKEPADMLEKYGTHRVWPRLPDGAPPGGSRRAVYRSRHGRLGHAPK